MLCSEFSGTNNIDLTYPFVFPLKLVMWEEQFSCLRIGPI
jgi:hypothetical protein